MADLVELLFFDTFAHENSEELNLDLVQFPKPVYVTEVRIIPLGARVQADFPGGVRLGATNPGQFQIEFFVNDLGKPGASTFETLGGFEYNQNGCINLVCVPDDTIRKIPTDGLVLRGWYTTITLAVYGTLTANIAEQIIPPVVTPSLPAQPNTISDVQQIISQNGIENEWQEPIQAVVPIEYSQQPATQYPQPYVQQDTYQQDNYGEYYNEVPKDPRSYHHTPETDWENKSRGRSIERDRDRGRDNTYQKSDLDHDHNDRRDRDKRFSRSQSRDKTSRDYRETSRDKDQDRDWDQPNFRENDKDWDRERDRDRYKHSDNYRRYSDREERKRPRTPPPMPSPKRPHTPHSDHKETSPKVSESVLEENRQKIDNKIEVDKPAVEETATMDVEEFEPILSDEDILDDSENFHDVDYDYSGYTNNDDLIKLFVPGQSMIKLAEVEPLYSVVDKKLVVSKQLKIIIGIADDFFKSSITKYTLAYFDKLNAEYKEEFIHLCEKVVHIFDNSKIFCIISKIYFEEIEECEIFFQVEFIMQTLESWLKIALNFEMANAQDQPAYKIRHIKCGVKLAEWCSESTHFLELLWRTDFYIHEVLFDLYEREYMALSIKLMILKALDAYLLNKRAVEVFLCGCFNDYANYKFTRSVNYKILVAMIDKNPSVRIKFALNSILMKLNCIEALYKVQVIIKKVIADMNYNYKEEELQFITETLEYFLNLTEIGPFMLSQPKRFLPVVSQFEINRSENKNSLVEIFQMQNILEIFLILLMHSSTMNSPNIKTTIYEILGKLIKNQQGLKYLLNNIDMVNMLIKILLHNEEDIFTLESDIKSHNLGLEIAYKLQALYHIENLKELRKMHDCESSNVIDQLHALFCLTFSNIGKLCVAKVLGLENNVECLLDYVDFKNDSKLRKSPAIGYIIDLLSMMVICVPNVPFLETYSKQLLEIITQSEILEAYGAKLTELEGYLKPYEVFKGSYDVAELIDTVGKNTAVSFSGVLITSLRILKHIGISKFSGKAYSENPLNNFNELKYKHVILQLFPLDGVGMLSKILLDLCEFYEQPSLHSAALVSNQGILTINIISPCVKLLKQMLTYVIQCRNTQFKDLTTVPVLLQTYNLCQSFPISSLGYYKAKKLCKDIVDTLLVYTQPISEEIHEKDSLSKTLWTLMCGEILKFTISAPHTFIAGLSVFSEILPLPLPIQTQNDLNSEEVSWAVNLRKLWSAHLHAHSNNIPDLIIKLCTTTYQPLLNLLRKICAQISDLAANSALMIARGILDNVHNAIVINDDTKKLVCNGYIARLMNFLACLVTHNSLKCTFLYLLSNGSGAKGDEKYPAIIQAFAQILRSTSNLNSHVQTQECILSIIQSFCDTEITLYQDTSSEIYLSNALPNKEHLLVFLNTMLEHICAENSFLTYLPVVRTLLLLTEHDYGFYHLKECLLKKSLPFKNILSKLETSFSKDNADCLSTVNTLMEFLRVCSEPEEVVGIVNQPRTMRMTVSQIQSLLGWKKDGGEENPFGKLEETLKAVIQEDSAFEALLESLQATISFLNTKSENELKEIYVEPQLPPSDPLLVQFAGRSIFTTRTEVANERLTASYWLNSLGGEETDGSCDPENVRLMGASTWWTSSMPNEFQVNCDLVEICRQDLSSDVNLVKQVEKLCRVCPSESTEQVEKEKQINAQKDRMKRPFVTPIRGRGFARTIQVRSDLFRSRPPNTSRPPSLHVDDFVALETCGAQPTGPTGYNRISRELLATSRVARGPRGRAFVASERAVQYRQMSWWGHGTGRAPY